MNGRLGRLVTIAAGFTALGVLTTSPAGAAECGLLGVLCPAPASSPAPAPAQQPAPASQPGPAPSQAPAAPGVIAEVPQANVRLLQLVNQERAAAGLVTLASRPEIAAFSTRHSTAMAGRRTIWHSDSYFTAATRHQLGAQALGENVALNGSLEDAHRRLMASPGHRANILNGRFDAVGISVVHDESGTLYVTESFVDSAGSASVAPAKAKATAKKASRSRLRKVSARASRSSARRAPARR